MQDVRELTQRWFEEVWNQKRLATVDELLAPEVRAHGFPEFNSVQDAAGFKASVVQFHNAFPKIQLKMQDVFVDGDKSAVRWTATLHGREDATDKPAAVSGFATARWSSGQIVEAWNFVDMTAVIAKMQEMETPARTEVTDRQSFEAL
ncbi:ester cyclase [Terriglobus roseus]|uniref:SnoaL-like polyketide cyclase n=1 Tax=Terriglobus roseus TaxID=392734 RepID=A0A1H4SRT9_9BACT|nr:ester cyclase [Terriglobus roseus]SEC46887.1 SnoaL-like polyketide cyclase [Terriglobus roseus]